MKQYIEDELNDAMNTMEVLINSEHRDLFLDVLSSYVRNKSLDNSKKSSVSSAMRTLISK